MPDVINPGTAGPCPIQRDATGTRVLRGGSWLNASVEARTTYRLPPFPGDFLFDPTDGFRCAMSDG